jgi:hypothetical protein
MKRLGVLSCTTFTCTVVRTTMTEFSLKSSVLRVYTGSHHSFYIVESCNLMKIQENNRHLIIHFFFHLRTKTKNKRKTKTMIDISLIEDRVGLFIELYNRAKIQGRMSTLDVLTREYVVEHGYIDTYVDYLNGRLMKICVPSNTNILDQYLYDRDNGFNAVNGVVDFLIRNSLYSR